MIRDYIEGKSKFTEINVWAIRSYALTGAIGFMIWNAFDLYLLFTNHQLPVVYLVALWILTAVFIAITVFRSLTRRVLIILFFILDIACIGMVLAVFYVMYQDKDFLDYSAEGKLLLGIRRGIALIGCFVVPFGSITSLMSLCLTLGGLVYGHLFIFEMPLVEHLRILITEASLFVLIWIYRRKQFLTCEELKTRLNSEREYNSLLDTLPQAIAIVDERLEILHSNQSFQGLREQLAVGLNDNFLSICNCLHVRLITDQSQELGKSSYVKRKTSFLQTPVSLEEYVRTKINNVMVASSEPSTPGLKTYQHLDAVFQDDGGQSHYFEIKIGNGTYHNTKVVILVFNDISQLKENIELRQSNEDKTTLLGTIAHEVRSPLGATISLMACAVSDQIVPQYVKDTYLIQAINSSKMLLNIVNDFLDYAQIDCNKIRIVMLPTDLRKKLIEITQLLSFQAASKGLKLDLEFIGMNIPELVNVDPNRLSQILINLINNALKFTEKGSIRV